MPALQVPPVLRYTLCMSCMHDIDIEVFLGLASIKAAQVTVMFVCTKGTVGANRICGKGVPRCLTGMPDCPLLPHSLSKGQLVM